MTTSLDLTRKTTVRWRIFLLILLIVAINYVDRASLSVAMPAISKEFGIDAAAQGVILSSFFWTYAFMQIPGGWLADRYRPRLIIATATILWGVFQALAALATGWSMLLLARLGLGVAEGPVFPASGKLNAVWLPARERGRGAVLIDGGAPLGDRIWRADHRVADRRVRFLANGLCGRRIGHYCGGPLRLLVHT